MVAVMSAKTEHQTNKLPTTPGVHSVHYVHLVHYVHYPHQKDR